MSRVRQSNSAPEPPWRNSDAQKELRSLLLSGEVPSLQGIMSPSDIWNTFCAPRPAFSGFLFNKFPPRLRAMQKQHLVKSGRAANEHAALAHDRIHFPRPSHNHRGEPQWHGSDAERLLKFDVAAKNHETMTPQQLYGTRTHYQVYPLEVFRKHIHQEVRLLKMKSQYGKN
ncbi:hypothetical protein MHU86_13582 [Fragilaria crotonensis]|nr:hypothetical protein MHU86_13582 [Fragilaria crotonensis]